jgi:hypothetical protein
MSEADAPSNVRYLNRWCRPRALQSLFRDYPVVLVGDELGAFYLDSDAASKGLVDAAVPFSRKNIFGLWDRRNLREAKTAYMEFVYAAFEQGVGDVVIDMDTSMQPGIDAALQIYHRTAEEKSAEAVFDALLSKPFATPMDAVVEMAGSLGMRVHAVNSGLTGIATLLREAQGIQSLPQSGDLETKAESYLKHGLEKDKEVLEQLLRRAPSSLEIETMCCVWPIPMLWTSSSLTKAKPS